MYTLSEQQIDFILNDIKTRGVEMEDLQLNLLDHICCIIECELQPDGNFDHFYQQTIPRFFKKELKEIEEETILLLTFKNYYVMKKVMITSGIISVTAFIAGSFFKVMHWPGASMLLFLAIMIMSFIFLPLVFILKTKDSNSGRDKIVTGIGILVGMLLSLFILFKIMHWPGGNILGGSSLAIFFFLFIPVYFFTGIRNPENKLNTIVTTIILVGVAGLQFTLINVRPPKQQTEIKMYAYIQSEELLKKMQQKNDPATNKLAADINTTAEQIKGLILENMIGAPSVTKDFEKSKIVVEEGNLGEQFNADGKGKKLFSHLKEKVIQYNTALTNTDNKIPLGHFHDETIGWYSNFVVLDYLVQLQMYVATNENKLTASTNFQ